MSPNSSKVSEGQILEGNEVSAGRRLSFGRRLGLGVLLPLWVVAGFFLSLVVLGVVGKLLLLAGISLTGISSALLDTVFAAVSYSLTAFIVIGLPGVIRRSRTTLADLGLMRLPTWKDILLAVAGFAVYFISAGVLITIASSIIPGFDAQQVQDVGFENLARRYEYALAFITLVVVAPVAEEILMRGYLYGRLRRIMPVASAMIVTAALFAVLHLQWNVAVDVFALSLVLTSLREMTDNIWASIFVHMMKNGLAFYLLFINTSVFHTIGG